MPPSKPPVRAVVPRSVADAHELGELLDARAAELPDTFAWILGDASDAAVRFERVTADATERLAPRALVCATDRVHAALVAGTLASWVEAAVAGAAPGDATLVVAGSADAVAGLEEGLAALQLDLGISVRRVWNAAALADLLVQYALALRSAPAAAAEDFLSGLTSHDVLFNQKVSRQPPEQWRGALQQLGGVSERAAAAIAAEYPSFLALHDRFRTAADPENAIADLRVGQSANARRLGPCRSRRVHRIMSSTDGDELVYPADE